MSTITERVEELARKIANCDFIVEMAGSMMLTGDEDAIWFLCIGESSWSRCITFENTMDDDPMVVILEDDGMPLSQRVLKTIPVAIKMPFSEFIGNSYVGIREHLKPEEHKNARLNFL